MNAGLVAVAVLCGLATYVFSGATHGRARLTAVAERVWATRGRSRKDAVQSASATSWTKPRAAVLSCLLCAGVAWLLFGGFLGLVVAAAIATVGPGALARLESRGTRAHRLALDVAAPTVADLMAACLASGTSTAAATQATAQALGGPVADVLGKCVTQFNLGASPVRVWKPMADEPALAPIARAILRSAETGAPLTSVLLRVADDLRLTRRTRLEQAAKTVGVKAVGPLGLCFLPAFMLLGVVPLIASLISAGIS